MLPVYSSSVCAIPISTRGSNVWLQNVHEYMDINRLNEMTLILEATVTTAIILIRHNIQSIITVAPEWRQCTRVLQMADTCTVFAHAQWHCSKSQWTVLCFPNLINDPSGVTSFALICSHYGSQGSIFTLDACDMWQLTSHIDSLRPLSPNTTPARILPTGRI